MVTGKGGNDGITGGRGRDNLHGGGGTDSIAGQAGADTITSQDTYPDFVSCGGAVDSVNSNRSDQVMAESETLS
ncbi:MAG: hypothetical protein ACRDOY_05445 [Nocardioidaceae bacterium]